MRVGKRLGALLLMLGAGAAEAASADARTTLRVGITQDFPPYEYLDEDGRAAGFSVALLEQVAKLGGYELEISAGAWHHIRAELEAGRLDLAPSMVRTGERDELLDFSAPTVLVEYRVFVRDSSPLQTLDEVRVAGVAVERETFWHDRLLEHFPDVQVTAYPTAAEVLRAVSDGRAPAGVLLMDQRLYLARREGITNLRSLDQALIPHRYRFAVPEGRRELVHELNDGLHEVIQSGAYDEIYDRWLGVLRDEGMVSAEERAWLIGAGGVLAVFLLIALLWSHALQSQVERRTRELRQRDLENLDLQRQLMQTQKMESLGRLAAGVAHDFNNLLSAILGHVHIVEREFETSSPTGRALAGIQKAGKAGAELTRQLLAFSRQQEVEPATLSWNTVIHDSREMLERPLTSRITVHFEPDAALWTVRLDPGQAIQILLNLLVNARDAIQGTGNVWIEASNVTEGDAELVRLSVRDDGEGMNEETRERIFEPFFTTKGEGKGSGLGLATLYGIVEQNAGRIEVESRPGEGSRFDVLLPRAPGG